LTGCSSGSSNTCRIRAVFADDWDF
jgi:hypothetical protein